MPAGPDQHRSVSPAAAELCIVADDLTGACDAAVAFAGGDVPVRVLLDLEPPVTGGGVWAVSTGTRDVPADEAREALAGWASTLAGRARVFKKIDSVFRGNTFVEIVTAAGLFPADLVVLAPAYPAVGRRLREGVLAVDGANGVTCLPVADELRMLGWKFAMIEAGLPVERLQSRLRTVDEHGSGAVLCDAVEQGDLVRMVEAARGLGRRVLWIGSGGLAHALAACEGVRAASASCELPAGEAVFFVGSDHPATLAQVEALAGEARVVKIERGVTSAAEIEAALEGRSPKDIGCLLMTGGDTAQMVCAALGIRALRLEREFAPGVPLGRAEGGRFDGVAVLLKSGGFGARDLMLDVHHACAGKVEAGF